MRPGTTGRNRKCPYFSGAGSEGASIPHRFVPERHLDAIRKYLDAGYEYVYVHQVGNEQDGFFDFYRREVLPKLG